MMLIRPSRKPLKRPLRRAAALPGDADDVYAITTAAMHADSSSVTAHTYGYKAAAGYVGDDQVILTATEQHSGGRGGNCGGGHGGQTEAVVTINVHIVADTTTTATTTRVGG